MVLELLTVGIKAGSISPLLALALVLMLVLLVVEVLVLPAAVEAAAGPAESAETAAASAEVSVATLGPVTEAESGLLVANYVPPGALAFVGHASIAHTLASPDSLPCSP